MKMKHSFIASAIFIAAASAPCFAQVPFDVVVPAGVQKNPAGFYNINNDVWFGDAANGIVHYQPADPTNPDPLATGTYTIDLRQGWTLEGIAGSQFASFNDMGQISRVSDTLALFTVRDTGRGADGKPVGGVWSLAFDPNAQPGISPVGNPTHLVPDKGLNGSQPTSVAIGPDGKAYFGNVKNPSLQRINGANVESVGTALNGKPILSLAFNGSDLYMGTGDGFYVLPNAPACAGNQNNCGRPQLLIGGATSAVASDGLGHVFFAQAAGGTVGRFTVSTATVTPIVAGLTFDANVTAGLGLDREGNLWIGQTSQIDRVSASNLAALP
jgi:hypothetical protein